MKVSIITTIYKAEKDLPRLLDSMMALKSPELEFFLIDNGSPDRCGEICAEYAKKDPRFVVRTIKDNIGYIGARMLGIRECDGDYVGFSDSDDYLEIGGYDHAIKVIKQYDCDLYITAYNVHDGKKVSKHMPPYATGIYEAERIIKVIRPQAFGFLKGKDRLHGFMWKHIYRRNILINNGIVLLEDVKPWEDQLFNIDVINYCKRLFVDDQVIYNYFANSGSITANVFKNFDEKDFWNKTRRLYNEREKRAVNRMESFANANASLYNLDTLVVSLCKNKARDSSSVVNVLNALLSNDAVAHDILSKSSGWSLSKRLLFVKSCLAMKLYKFLVMIVRYKLSSSEKLLS